MINRGYRHMNFEYVNCDLCGANNSDLLFEGRDRLHGLPGSFPMVQCRDCGLVYLNPCPDESSMADFYPEDYSPFASDRGLIGYLRAVLRRREAAGIAGSLSPGARVLEVGCAAGELLTALRDRGLRVTGLEPSLHAAEKARREHRLDIYQGTVFDVPFSGEQFDAVVLRHVIEHFPSPRAALEKIRTWLTPGGFLHITTPNFDSLDRRLFKSLWHDFEPPRHQVVFSEKTLRRLMKDCGFHVNAVYFDVVPNDWVHSSRNLLQTLAPGRSLYRFFDLKNPLALAMFLPLTMLQRLMHFGGRMQVTAMKIE